MVGTVFVNSMANTLSTMASNTTLVLKPTGSLILQGVRGGYPHKFFGEGYLAIDIGSILYGQPRDIVVDYAVASDSSSKYIHDDHLFSPIMKLLPSLQILRTIFSTAVF